MALTALAGRQFREQAANAALLADEVALRTGELQTETAALEVLNRTGTDARGRTRHRPHHAQRDRGGGRTHGAQVGAFFYRASAIDDATAAMTVSNFMRVAGSQAALSTRRPTLRDTNVFLAVAFDRKDRAHRTISWRSQAKARPRLSGPSREAVAPMRSYMAVPVVSRTGNINGVLVFGHEKTRVFTERSERLMQGLAAQAAIALENGRLYQAAQYEIEERKQSQAQQSLLIRELASPGQEHAGDGSGGRRRHRALDHQYR